MGKGNDHRDGRHKQPFVSHPGQDTKGKCGANWKLALSPIAVASNAARSSRAPEPLKGSLVRLRHDIRVD